jgi:hypothetical protein
MRLPSTKSGEKRRYSEPVDLIRNLAGTAKLGFP